MRIANRQIGPGHLPYVIAELGVNHDGSPERALALTEAAARAGADAIKLQWFRAELLMSRGARLAAYQRDAGETDPVAMLRRLELPAEAISEIVRRAHALGLHAIVTVFSVELVEPAARLPWDAFKTASPDLVNRPLLDALMATGRPLIVSTGAAEAHEVERALEWLGPARGRLALLQCVSSYPTRAENAAVGAMEGLRAMFDGPVGYSDHTTQTDTGGLAAALGAAVLEKHLTLDRRAPGPDHAASLEPAELLAYAALARDEGAMLAWMEGRTPRGEDPRIGPPVKRVLECERDVRRVSRQSITTRRALRAGQAVSREDLTIKRPGIGLEPWRLGEVAGRRLARDVEADVPLTEEDLA